MINQRTLSTLALLMLADSTVEAHNQLLENSSITAGDVEAHPVRQEIVDQVKRRTNKWKPREIKDNHFKDKSAREIRDGTLGSLDSAVPTQTPAADPFDSIGEKWARSQGGLMGTFNALYQSTMASVSETLGSGLKKDPDYEDLPFKVDTIDDATRHRQRVAESRRPKKDKITGDVRLPQHYFYRDQYPNCKPRVLNQQMCGSCWAFSSAGMLEDRFCMHTDGQIQVTLSPQDMVNCDFENFGCKGGYMVPAIDFLITEGVAEYDCLPYINDRKPCTFKCEDQKRPYEKYYCRPGSMKIETDIGAIQADIYHNGPVMVGLMVYEDLYSYESGIYEYTAGGLIGGHSIRAVGWGHDEDGQLYWICQNQWTDKWGMNGYVNIKAGEIGIDYWSLSCLPDISIKK